MGCLLTLREHGDTVNNIRKQLGAQPRSAAARVSTASRGNQAARVAPMSAASAHSTTADTTALTEPAP